MRKRYVSFTLGAGHYCIPVDQVVQILRPENILEVPKAPPYVDGVINLRGDVVPVVNLRARLGIRLEARIERPAAAGMDTRAGLRARIVVIRVGNRSYGLAVDEVREIVEIDEGGVQHEAMEAFGMHAEFIQGVAHRDESMYLILDLPHVLSAGRDIPGAERT